MSPYLFRLTLMLFAALFVAGLFFGFLIGRGL